MTREELQVARQYARAITHMACRHQLNQALETIYCKAKEDTDITDDVYKILSAMADGIADYTPF